MTLKNISGQVLIDNEQVGNVSGTYKDDSYNGSQEQINNVSVPITATMDNEKIGNGSMNYQDYVTYNGGGSRTIDVNGDVLIDTSKVGVVNATLVDDYGAVQQQVIPSPSTASTTSSHGIPWWIIIIGLLLLLFLR